MHDCVDDEWRRLCVPRSGCRVFASVYSFLNSDRLSEAPIAMVRAAAANAWKAGVDGLYLNQFFNSALHRLLLPFLCFLRISTLHSQLSTPL